MPTTYKILGQSKPSATTNTTLYTVPPSTSSVVSTLIICNDSATPTVYRIAIASSASPSASEYIIYGAAVPANDSVFLTLGMTIEQNKQIVVYSASANLIFSAFGSEIT